VPRCQSCSNRCASKIMNQAFELTILNRINSRSRRSNRGCERTQLALVQDRFNEIHLKPFVGEERSQLCTSFVPSRFFPCSCVWGGPIESVHSTATRGLAFSQSGNNRSQAP